MAALAGGSLGFFTFAMPRDLFERLVGATGLPAMVPAAQPPLGDTARIAFVAAAALGAFLLAWLLLRALDKRPAAAVREPAADLPADPPRLRRADMHPDAPSRHPLRAGSDLGVPLDTTRQERGEPIDLAEAETVDFEAEWERPAPSFLTGTAEVPVEVDALADEPDEVDEPEYGETYEAKYEADPVEVPFWLPEGSGEAAQDEASVEIEQSEQPFDPEGGTILPFWAQQSANQALEAASRAPEPSHDQASLDQLSNRLEGGLIRRKRDGRSTRPRGQRGVDERLRSALDDLGKITGRG
jgi:hypothetical protein